MLGRVTADAQRPVAQVLHAGDAGQMVANEETVIGRNRIAEHADRRFVIRRPVGQLDQRFFARQTIQHSGGFGNPATRKERLERLAWALDRTRALGLSDLMLHAGFIPEPGDADRKAFLDTLGKVSVLAAEKGVMIAFETGQETADLLRLTLDELKCKNLGVNFDPANMLLYDKGDPIRAVEILAPDIRSVHVKDANRPKVPGTWGEEVPLGEGEVDIRAFLKALQKVGYRGPLCIEREVGDQESRIRDVAHGIRFVRECLA